MGVGKGAGVSYLRQVSQTPCMSMRCEGGALKARTLGRHADNIPSQTLDDSCSIVLWFHGSKMT